MRVFEGHMDPFLLSWNMHLGMKLLSQKIGVYLALVLLPVFQSGGTSSRKGEEPQLLQYLFLLAFFILIIHCGLYLHFLWMISELFS